MIIFIVSAGRKCTGSSRSKQKYYSRNKLSEHSSDKFVAKLRYISKIEYDKKKEEMKLKFIFDFK